MNQTPALIFTAFRILMSDRGVTKSFEDADLLVWLNEGRSAAYVLRPDLFGVTEPVALVAGVDQTVPNGSKRLLDVIRNVSHRKQRAITPIDSDILNRLRPDRRSEQPSDEIQHFAYDETDPTTYEVYPPAKAGTQIEVRSSVAPEEIGAGELNVELAQEGPLAVGYVDYLAGRAFQVESVASSAVTGLSERHINAFVTLFTGDATATASSSPNATREGSVRTQ